MLDAGAEPGQGLGAARIEAGHDVVVVLGVAGYRVHPRQLQQALGVDGGFQRLADHPGGIVEAQEGVPQAVLGAAQIGADARRGEAVAALFHQVGPARNVAAGGGDAAAGVLDEAAGDQVRPHRQRFPGLGELAVAVVHEDDCLGVGLAGHLRHLADGFQIKGVALGVATAALDVHHRGGLGLPGDQVVIRHLVGQQRAFVVLHAVFPQRAAALAGLPDADDPLQRVVGAAGGRQQRVAGAQQAEQCHRQRVGAAHELGPHQSGLGAHAAGKHLLQLVAAVIPDAVAAGTPEMPRLHAAVGEGFQHLELVVVPDFLHVGELLLAEFQCLAVQRQHLRLEIVKLFDHTVSHFRVNCCILPAGVKPRRV